MASSGTLHDVDARNVVSADSANAVQEDVKAAADDVSLSSLGTTQEILIGSHTNGTSQCNNGRVDAIGVSTLLVGTEDADTADTVTTNTDKIRLIVEQSASEESKKKIDKLLAEVRQLPDLEKLLLYLQLPTGSASSDPLRQTPNNPLGNRFEVTQTVTWIKTHLEEDSEVSLPKHEVYEDYCHFCNLHSIKPLSTADFGKVMKQVFPSVRPRRLGTRGNSKYCYAGLRKRVSLDVPTLPNLSGSRESAQDEALAMHGLSEDMISACSYVILDWAHKLFDQKFDSLKELACHLVESKLVDVRSFGAFTVLSLLPNVGKGNQASMLLNQSGGNKHRETQLQLQRKLQEKELIREQKKRLHDLKTEKFTPKERRRAASGPCGRSTRLPLTGLTMQGYSMPATPLSARDVSSPLSSANSISSGNLSTVASNSGNGLAEKNCGALVGSKVVGLNGESDFSTLKIEAPSTVGQACSRGEIASQIPLVPDLQHKVGKVQIPRITNTRNSPKVCIAPTLPASIIFVPQLSQIGELAKCTSKLKPKYKPIQPKPLKTNDVPALVEVPQNSAGQNGGQIRESSDKQEITEKDSLLQLTEAKKSEKRPVEDKTMTNGSSKRQRSEEESVTESALETFYESSSFIEKTAEALFEEDFTNDNNTAVLLSQSNETLKVSEEELSQVLGPTNKDSLEDDLQHGTLMDFMDGSSTSMEQDEELSHYFSENIPGAVNPLKRSGDSGQTAQLTQLRRLLEHNLKPSPPTCGWQGRSQTLRELLAQPAANVQVCNTVSAKCESKQQPCQHQNGKEDAGERVVVGKKDEKSFYDANKAASVVYSQASQPLPSVELLTGFSMSQHASELGNLQSIHSESLTTNTTNAAIRRRVSFPSNLSMGSADATPLPSGPATISSANSSVPQSPNTRCRSFNFTPISPRHTPLPNEMKCMTTSQPPSATASPFMSPSSTPVPHPRSRHNSGQAMSSYGTTPRSTPYPSEQSSSVNSPFISPHATPLPFSRSRHNSSQSVQRLVFPSGAQISPGNYAFTLSGSQSRSRHSSGAAMSLMSPRSAPMSPLNYLHDSEMGPTQLTLPTVGDTPQMRSRHNSNSSIPSMSPRSAPLSPQMHHGNAGTQVLGSFPNTPQLPVPLEIQDVLAGTQPNVVDWQTTSPQDYQNVMPTTNSTYWYLNNSGSNNDPRLLARQRHASMGATIHHLPTTLGAALPVVDNVRDLSGFDPSVGLMLQRSRSVPLNEMIQNIQQQQECQQRQQEEQMQQQQQQQQETSPPSSSHYSYPDPSAVQYQTTNDLMVALDASGFSTQIDTDNLSEQYSARKNLSDMLGGTEQNPSDADDLQATLEDLRACDNDYSRFAQEMEHQSGGSSMQ